MMIDTNIYLQYPSTKELRSINFQYTLASQAGNTASDVRPNLCKTLSLNYITNEETISQTPSHI